jgi:hypothetical protein
MENRETPDESAALKARKACSGCLQSLEQTKMLIIDLSSQLSQAKDEMCDPG